MARLIAETLRCAQHVPSAVIVDQRGVRAWIGGMAPPAGNTPDDAGRGLAVGRLNAVLLRLERLARSCSHVLALLGGHGLPQAGDDGGVSGRERVMDCCHVYVLPK